MISEKSRTNELLAAIDEVVVQLLGAVSALDEDGINTVPFKDSWTAAQLLRHITKSTVGMSGAMSTGSKPAKRDPGERIPELKKVFLDFSHKLKSPDFIVPEVRTYSKHDSIEELKRSFEQLKKNATHADLTELVEGLPLGPITKLEILHFVVYHTQRHVNQLERIVGAVKNL